MIGKILKRWIRYFKVRKLSEDFFGGDRSKSIRWLNSPKKSLGGKRPIDMLDSDESMNEVINLIGRLENGVFT